MNRSKLEKAIELEGKRRALLREIEDVKIGVGWGADANTVKLLQPIVEEANAKVVALLAQKLADINKEIEAL